MQANRRMRQRSSYLRSGVLSKRRSESRLDGLLAEAAAREVPRRARPRPAALDQPPSPFDFGLEGVDGVADHRFVEGFGQQAVPDRLVAPAPVGQGLCPGPSDPLVVDEPGALKRCERFSGHLRRNGPFQPFGEPASREIAAAQRTPGDAQPLCSSKLAAHQSQRFAVERPPLHQAGANGDVGREDAPRRTVQLDRHATAAVVAEPSDGRQLPGLGGGFPDCVGLGLHLAVLRGIGDGQQPCRGDLLRPELYLDLRQDPLAHVGMLA
jgi:hypothetical protein